MISLPRSKGRLEAFWKSREASGWVRPTTVAPGIECPGVSVPGWFDAPAGYVGCMAAHLNVWRMVLDNNDRDMLIFEDDATFRPDCGDAIVSFLSDVPKDWDMIYLGGHYLGGVPRPEGQCRRVNDLVARCPGLTTTHAYAITADCARRIMPLVCKWPLTSIDVAIGHAQIELDLNVYRPHQWFVGQAAGVSEITGNFNPESFWE